MERQKTRTLLLVCGSNPLKSWVNPKLKTYWGFAQFHQAFLKAAPFFIQIWISACLYTDFYEQCGTERLAAPVKNGFETRVFEKVD